MDINSAIAAYSHAGGNRSESLQAICAAGPIAAEAIAAEIIGLQEGILEGVRSQSGPNGLPRSQIEQLARQYLAAKKPEVNEVGLRGLLSYVLWVAWHDGWLQRE